MENGQYTYADVMSGANKTVDRDEDLAIWGGSNIKEILGVLTREHAARMTAERRLRGDAPPPEEKCGARAVGGPCVLPAGHNRGQVDIPSNHQTGPAHRNNRAHEIGRELAEIDKATEHLIIAYTNNGKTRYDAVDSKVFTELSNRREVLRRELYEMG